MLQAFDSAYVTKTNTLNMFFTRTTTCTNLTLLDETFNNLPKLTTNRNLTPVTTVTVPYIKGTSEIYYKIRVAYKPTTMLQHLLTNIKGRDETNNRQGAVYKIKFSDCQASYIGETGRNLNTTLTEHK